MTQHVGSYKHFFSFIVYTSGSLVISVAFSGNQLEFPDIGSYKESDVAS